MEDPAYAASTFFYPHDVDIAIARLNALFNPRQGVFSPLLAFEHSAIDETVLSELGATEEERKTEITRMIDEWLIEAQKEKLAFAMDVYRGQFCGFTRLFAVRFFTMYIDDIGAMVRELMEQLDESADICLKLEELQDALYFEAECYEAMDALLTGKDVDDDLFTEVEEVPVIVLSNKRSSVC